MNNNLEASLEEAIVDSLEKAEDNLDNPDARKAAIQELEILVKARNEVVKTEAEVAAKEAELEAKEAEKELEEKRQKTEKIFRILQIGLGVLEIGVPLACYGCWLGGLMRFEESGHAPGSPVFRMFLKELRPKK